MLYVFRSVKQKRMRPRHGAAFAVLRRLAEVLLAGADADEREDEPQTAAQDADENQQEDRNGPVGQGAETAIADQLQVRAGDIVGRALPLTFGQSEEDRIQAE